MYRNRFFEVLESPYTPYIAVELIYAIVTIWFNISLGNLNKQLTHHFDIDKMITRKDVTIATHVMSYKDNSSWNYLIFGGVLILIGFMIPIVSSIINKSSYKEETIKNVIWCIIFIVSVVNIFLIISISQALFSPIIIATLIMCAVGAIFGAFAISNT
ncbi:hypothetical protein PCY17_03940 [Streptococcus sp. SO2]|uniref:hypothetical protein n=1 Tax=Streptococcus sp. SO2 TaxID=3018248 RepID=UPI00263D3FAC|nr:hypothetical protein [Streptococcus sp. SO2]MDN5014392.1 hypothetical protein [Streptococcus sp. SO2]